MLLIETGKGIQKGDKKNMSHDTSFFCISFVTCTLIKYAWNIVSYHFVRLLNRFFGISNKKDCQENRIKPQFILKKNIREQYIVIQVTLLFHADELL